MIKKFLEFINEKKKWTPPTVGEEAKELWWQQHHKELIDYVSNNRDTAHGMIEALSDEDVANATMKGSDKQISETILQLMDIKDIETEIGLDTNIYIPPK